MSVPVLDLWVYLLCATDLLSKCDVLVYDYLVNPDFRRLCRRGCEMVDVGKAPGRHSISQEQIHEILLDKAKEGLQVVRLKGGIPLFWAWWGREGNLVANIEVEIVPGVTAALGCAAQNGIPLTHRDFSSSLTLLTGHETDRRSRRSTLRNLRLLVVHSVFIWEKPSQFGHK